MPEGQTESTEGTFRNIVESGLIAYLANQLPNKIDENEASELELALKSGDKDQASKAFERIKKLCVILLANAQQSDVAAIKIFIDLFIQEGLEKIDRFFTTEDNYELTLFSKSNTRGVFTRGVLEILEYKPTLLMSLYNKTIEPSIIKFSTTSSSYETVYRKYTLMHEELENDDAFKLINTAVNHLFTEPVITKHVVLLSILDLYVKKSKSIHASKIQNAAEWCEAVFAWDKKNLKKHNDKKKPFFDIADKCLRENMKFESMAMASLKNKKDFPAALDLVCRTADNKLEKRIFVLKEIEKKWEKNQAAINSKNHKKSQFVVSNQCHLLLTAKQKGWSQPKRIEEVIRFLNKNFSAANLKDYLESSFVGNKQIVVYLNADTNKKINSLRKKLKLNRSKLLEFATYHYMQAENSSTGANKAQDLPMDSGNTHQTSEATQKPTPEKPTVEPQRPIENRQAPEYEQQTEHLQHQIPTAEQNKASQQALAPINTALNTTQSPVNSNEITDSEQQEKQQPSTDDAHFSETNQRIENKQSISTDELSTTPDQSQQAEPDQNPPLVQPAPPLTAHQEQTQDTKKTMKQERAFQALMRMGDPENQRGRW